MVTVEGPRGKLVKDLGHLAVTFAHPKRDVISIEIHHGVRKNVAALRTVKTIIENMVIGVTKGFKYKMRYVYAHFPINVSLDKDAETDLWQVEIRNFIGEKIVRRVTMQPGVDVEASKSQKDELILSGNSVEAVSQSAADIQQICKVRNKDIRKVRPTTTHSTVLSSLQGYSAVNFAGTLLTSHLTVPRRSLRFREGQHC